MQTLTKIETVRAFVTHVLKTGHLNSLPFPVNEEITGSDDKKEQLNFWGTYTDLIKKLVSRKDNLPSLERVIELYQFDKLETNYSHTDLVDLLNEHHTREATLAFVTTLSKNFSDLNLVSEINNFVQKISLIRMVNNTAKSVNVVKDIDMLIKEYKEKQSEPRIVMGLPRIDKYAPAQKGKFIFYVGATNAGKSLTLRRNVLHFLQAKRKVQLYNLELSPTDVVDGMLIDAKLFSFDQLEGGLVQPDDWKKAVRKMVGKDAEFELITRRSDTEVSLRVIEEKIKAGKPDIVVIDYMGILDDVNFSWEIKPSVSQRLKDMAVKYNCLMLTAVQNNDLEPGKMPSLANISLLKALAHDADTVIGIATNKQGDGTDERQLKLQIEYAVLKARKPAYPRDTFIVRPHDGSWESYE